MRRAILVLTLLAAAAATATATAGTIDLRIRFQANAASQPRLSTLRCGNRPAGTVPRPAAACERLLRLGEDAFRPTPPNTACTEISGGPSSARVTGIYFGRPLWVRLRRDNGCEISRWRRVAFLLPQPAAP